MAKPGGISFFTILIFLFVLLGIEAVVDFFGLPFDEILVPIEGIIDVLMLLLMAGVQIMTGNRSRRIQ